MRAFRFRKNYGPNEEIEANKAELKDKYVKAKQLGREVTVSCSALIKKLGEPRLPLRITRFEMHSCDNAQKRHFFFFAEYKSQPTVRICQRKSDNLSSMVAPSFCFQETKARIGELKSQVEKRRLELAVQRMSRGEDGIALIGQDDPVEAEYRGLIDDLKVCDLRLS